MKFIFADALDMIDPTFDFLRDRSGRAREMYWSDVYPNEFFKNAPYDGVLVSRGVVGDDRFPGKYPENLMMRFRRVGARAFLRLEGKRFASMCIFGDCGAFSYADCEVPPYTPEAMLDFYADGGFTHGCSVDHVVFEFDTSVRGMSGGSAAAKFRFDITLENAATFIRAAKRLRGFTPLGVVQGWSPESMAEGGRRLVKMGYRYLAVGGMVRLSAKQVHLCLQAIRERISPNIKLHLLGFAKAEQIHEFKNYGIASFDTTSPLTRAFKDSKANYYQRARGGGLDYYTAIRIPQAIENARFKRRAKMTGTDQERLVKLERKALDALRAFDRGNASIDLTVRSVKDYIREFLWKADRPEVANEGELARAVGAVHRTLADQPWKKCRCRVCVEAGIDAVIFRGSNRNKRRGFHNLMIYHEHFKRVTQ